MIVINKLFFLFFFLFPFWVFYIIKQGFNFIFYKALKFAIKFLIPDKPETASILEKRHKIVIKKVFTKLH